MVLARLCGKFARVGMSLRVGAGGETHSSHLRVLAQSVTPKQTVVLCVVCLSVL